MLILGIILGVLALGALASCIYFLRENDAGLSFFAFSLCAGFIIVSSCCINASLDSSEQKTIKCTEIQQIDTLYRNDSIVGYEITVMK